MFYEIFHENSGIFYETVLASNVLVPLQVLKQVEQDEGDAWHDLVDIRQKVVKYRTLSKDQITQVWSRV
jgi:hypothetical protein